MATRNKSSTWSRIIQNVTTPLGFYVLALLIIEGTLAAVLTFAKVADERRWDGFLWMIGVFIGVVVTVTILTVCCPKNLLFGKEEHSNPNADPGALRDHIEKLIFKNVRGDCLKPPREESH